MNSILKDLLQDQKNKELIKLNAVEIVEALFSELQERERDILTRRFSLESERAQTLEEIGKLHNLTRERVRQIEQSSLKKLKKIEDLDAHLESLKVMVNKLLEEHGGAMEKDFLLDILTVLTYQTEKGIKHDRKAYKKYLEFVLSELLDDEIDQVNKSDKFFSFFKLKNQAIDYLESLAEEVKIQLGRIKKTLYFEELVDVIKDIKWFSFNRKRVTNNDDLDLKKVFKDEAFPEWAEIINRNKPLYSLMQTIKGVGANKFGKWGKEEWVEVRPKKITDKIYLVLKNEKKPLHFTEITNKINEIGFDHKKVSPGSVHNELILDDRYVLVDRGVYALKK